MIKDILSEEEMTELKKNGYKLEDKNNILTIRNYAGEIAVEIICCAENEVLINTRENYYWGKKIDTIVSAYGESLYVYYTNNDDEEDNIVDN